MVTSGDMRFSMAGGPGMLISTQIFARECMILDSSDES